jgi:serine O-acetyltransferase
MEIKSIAELKKTLIQDAKANNRVRVLPKVFGDEIWRYIFTLRINEFCDSFDGMIKLLGFPIKTIFRIKLHSLSLKLGYSIPRGVIGKGLSIAHVGTIVINSNCEIGNNFRVQEGVTIGATSGSKNAPRIGNNVFVGSGAKIIGDIIIADDVAIGANAAVVKNILEPGTTWAGVPARKISKKTSHSNLSPLLNLK